MESGCRQLNRSTGAGRSALAASRRAPGGAALPRGCSCTPGAGRDACGSRRLQLRAEGTPGLGRRVRVGHAVRFAHGYQTRQRSCGCMWVPWAQWKASAKAARFCSEPSTLRATRGLSQLPWVPGVGEGGCPQGGGGCPRGGRGYLPVLQGAVDVGLDGLYGKLRPVGPAPHLWVHEGRGCRTGGRAGLGDGREE